MEKIKGYLEKIRKILLTHMNSGDKLRIQLYLDKIERELEERTCEEPR